MTRFCTCTVIEIDEFGGAVPGITPGNLSALGFDLGDTLDFAFSSGVTFSDIPYYNGYYAAIGEPVFVAYPGYKYPVINFNCRNFHEITGVSVGDTVTITMHEKAGKMDVMDIRGMVYSNDPQDYASPEVFANAREFRVGRIAAGKLYRCASPFDHLMNRPEAVSAFLERHQVKTTVSISESPESLERRYPEMPPYARSVYESGHVIPLGLGSEYFSDEFCAGLTQGLIRAMDHPFPWAIHCLEGKDRTGFVCTLLGALMDGNYGELTDDFMKTLDNYYGVTEASDPGRYYGFKSSFIDPYLRTFAGIGETDDPSGHDYSQGAAAYLRRGGMSDGQIEQLKQLLA